MDPFSIQSEGISKKHPATVTNILWIVALLIIGGVFWGIELSDGSLFILHIGLSLLVLSLGIEARANKLRKSSRCFFWAAGIFFVLAVFQGISLLLP